MNKQIHARDAMQMMRGMFETESTAVAEIMKRIAAIHVIDFKIMFFMRYSPLIVQARFRILVSCFRFAHDSAFYVPLHVYREGIVRKSYS